MPPFDIFNIFIAAKKTDITMKKLTHCISLFVLPLFLIIDTCNSAYGQPSGEPVRIACIGNSITYGSGIPNRDRDSWPAILGQMLGRGYDVRNYGLSGRTMLMKGDYPYMKEQTYKEVLGFNPDIVVIKLGTNDSKPHNWKYKNEFGRDMEKMIDDLQALTSAPDIYVCYPAKAYTNDGIRDNIISGEVIPLIDKTARKKNVKTIDLYDATSGMPEKFPDTVHPNPEGSAVLAESVYEAITGKKAVYEPQAFPGIKGEWHGGDRYDFRYNGIDATVVVPGKPAKGNPWIWRPAFFDAFPSVDIALLKEGFHIVYYDLTHLYGSPRSVRLGTDFYNYMRNYYGLSPYVTLEGFSRGGLFAVNWASENPGKTACIYLDAPVCDLRSWPSRERKEHWEEMLAEWNLTDKDMDGFKLNPTDRLAPLAGAGVPIIAVCGDADVVVPFKENMDVVRSRYAGLGGPVEVIIKPGVDHHPHSLEDPQPVVDFIVRNQPAYKTYQHINMRGSLDNSFHKFENEKKGRVAFLGGSITEMNGWKDMIEKQLAQRFPYTEFEFTEAGISSTGTTPGAFRFDNDVLSEGIPDLLFVEAAVNDDTNGFTYVDQVRGMEGVVRHALDSNPYMDIVMLHFIYDPFIPIVEKGKTPDVILNHERVANHYDIPSIDLVREITERMTDGELTWEEFGGTHPLPRGHAYYAASINRLFDEMAAQSSRSGGMAAHEIPEQPLDEYSYYNGAFKDIREAEKLKGFKYTDKWNPQDNAEKRRGFVNVPMLEGNKPGDRLTLDFTGKAVGIFCVAGPQAGILEYSVDGGPYKKLDTYTEWSAHLYIPWVYILETELEDKPHTLNLRISKDRNALSKGTQCVIRNFVVN